MTSRGEQYRGKLSEEQMEDVFAGGREQDRTISISAAFLCDGMTLTQVAAKFDTTRQNVYARVRRTLDIAQRKGVI